MNELENKIIADGGLDSNAILDHMRKIDERKQAIASFVNTGSLYYPITEGEHIVRFVGDLIVKKVHWINNAGLNKCHLYNDKWFNDKKLFANVTCLNWKIQEEVREERGCVLCKLNKMARQLLKEKKGILEPAELKRFEDLKQKTNDTTQYIWNIIPRKPDAKGFQIFTAGSDLFGNIMDIHKNYPKVFSSPDNGIDIKITRGKGQGKVVYSANLILKDGLTVAVTPLTDAERAWKPYNLVEVCGRQADQKMLYDCLEQKWKDLLALYEKSEKEAELI